MNRYLTTAPAAWDAEQLLDAAQGIWPSAIAVNDVAGEVAVYLPAGTDATEEELAAWATTVIEHVPSPPTDLATQVAAARASLAAATTVAQVRARTIAFLDLITPTDATP